MKRGADIGTLGGKVLTLGGGSVFLKKNWEERGSERRGRGVCCDVKNSVAGGSFLGGKSWGGGGEDQVDSVWRGKGGGPPRRKYNQFLNKTSGSLRGGPNVVGEREE